ncbi:hypothetical protein E4U15_003996 [Claviceps sp. LM218 group G6]|nr:hypothetical protein E4U15_003996 [Claviceps sp. LM218 group G6]
MKALSLTVDIPTAADRATVKEDNVWTTFDNGCRSYINKQGRKLGQLPIDRKKSSKDPPTQLTKMC